MKAQELRKQKLSDEAGRMISRKSLYLIFSFAFCGLTLAVAAQYWGMDLYFLPVFLHLFRRYDVPAALLDICILAGGVYWARRNHESDGVNKLLDSLAEKRWLWALGVLGVCAVGAVTVYHDCPLCMDEYMPFFQAKVFAAGKLWGQFPPALMPWLVIPHFFSVSSAATGRVVSSYWPGFALLLTPFMKGGVPWLLNPLLGAGTFLLVGYYAKKIFADNRTAAWALLFTVASPVILVNSISYYSMPAHLFLNLLYATLFLEDRAGRMVAAGFVGSLALVLHNPVPHTLFAIPWLAWAAWRPGRLKRLGCLLLGYLPCIVLLGFGWVWVEKVVAAGGPGLHEAVGQAKHVVQAAGPAIHSGSLLDRLLKLLLAAPLAKFLGVFVLPDMQILKWRFIALLKMFVWAVPGLPILALFGVRKIRGNVHLQLWLCSGVLTFVGYMFVPFDQGHGWGYRYFYSAWLVLPLLAAAFLASPLQEGVSWKKMLAAVSLCSLVFGTCLRFYQVNQFISEHLAQLPHVDNGKRELCFVDFSASGYYTRDLIQNDPFLRDPVIYLVRRGTGKDKEMLARYFPSARKKASQGLDTVWEIDAKDRARFAPTLGKYAQQEAILSKYF